MGDWGHEYLRQLESEIVDQWSICQKSATVLLPLVKDIVKYDCQFHAELQACDLLMEIDKLEILPEYIQKDTYPRICLYLASCAKYVDDVEAAKNIDLVAEQYVRFAEYPKALMLYMQMRNQKMATKVFELCKDPLVIVLILPYDYCRKTYICRTVLRQLAFMAARQLFTIELPVNVSCRDDLINIMSNSHLSSYFQSFAREVLKFFSIKYCICYYFL